MKSRSKIRTDRPEPSLNVRVFGTGRPVAALHGFTLTGEQFAPLGGRALQFHAADLPGHGCTRVTPIDLPTTIAAVVAWLSSFERPPPLLGYSQGGRIALLAALQTPELIERLILVSTSPGIADAGERTARRRRDTALASRIEAAGVEAFLDDWLADSITGTSHLDKATRRADRATRLENSAAGLAGALRGLGQGSQPYVGNRIGELDVPLLSISGERDTKYGDLAAAMASQAPSGRHVTVDAAGHNVVLDAPDELATTVAGFCGVSIDQT